MTKANRRYLHEYHGGYKGWPPKFGRIALVLECERNFLAARGALMAAQEKGVSRRERESLKFQVRKAHRLLEDAKRHLKAGSGLERLHEWGDHVAAPRRKKQVKEESKSRH